METKMITPRSTEFGPVNHLRERFFSRKWEKKPASWAVPACGLGLARVEWGPMIRRRSASEQAAAHLIEELARGRWRGVMPGVNRLAGDLGVSRETVRGALGLLAERGVLEKAGEGRPRRIVAAGLPEQGLVKSMRVAVLLREGLDEEVNSAFLRLVLRVRHRLEQAGHVCVFPPKTMLELENNPARIIRMVQRTVADAWLIAAGSLEVLEWFARQPVPTLALGGRIRGLPIAGASRNPLPAFRELFGKLIDMGHRRITLLSPPERRLPSPSAIERGFEEEMAVRGVPFGDFNVPDWKPTPDGLATLLRELFRVTPPTAIQAHSSEVAVGVLSFLHRRGLRVPEDVSVICESLGTAMAWHRPALAHFTTDYEAVLGRVVRWVEGVAKGRVDKRQVATGAVFCPGESIAPPKK
jgi:LacI family transcriptional regulator